jgi:tetratricopeptide (TPR) repeat protein
MAKRPTKKQPPRKKAVKKSSPKKKENDALPGPHVIEQMMRGIFDAGGRDPGFAAQELTYEAMEAMANEDWDRAAELAAKAAKLDPDCVDALLVLSNLGSENEDELIDNLRRTVERAERALGPKSFREFEGHFWGFLETRPYMRARAQLAAVLNEAGRVDEAVEHYEEMLRLNPNDNQGLRYPLVGCYLERRNLAGAERLFAEYPEEGSAMFAWAQVLASFLAGDETNALAALDEARGVNKHVEAYLTGRKKTPDDGPGYYSPGEPSEAIVCMHSIGTAWTMHPRAAEWLKRQKPKRK